MGEIEVVAEEVETFAPRVEVIRNILEEYIDDIVHRPADALSKAPVFRLKGEMLVDADYVGECAQDDRRDRSVALQLRIAQSEESKGSKLSRHMVCIGLGLVEGPMESFGGFEGFVGVSRGQGKRATTEEGIKIKVNRAGYRHRHQEAQAIAQESRD